jgi:hypothetical protein
MVISLCDRTHHHVQLLFILDISADLAYNNILFGDVYWATFGKRYWCKGIFGYRWSPPSVHADENKAIRSC